MIRAFFLACGTFLSLCGVLLLAVDRVVLTATAARQLHGGSGEAATLSVGDGGNGNMDGPGEASGGEQAWQFLTHDTVDPPDWAAVGLMSIGGVTLLYTFSLSGRRDEDEDDDEEEDDDLVFLSRRPNRRRSRRAAHA